MLENRDELAEARDLVTVALGRLGAGEMLFGSDLDLVFLTREKSDRTGATNIARRLHAGGLVHKDLYLCHLFVPKGACEVTLIDLARVTRTTSSPVT